MTSFEKKLIVGGCLNTTITLDEILDNFEESDWTRAAWSVLSKLNVYHNVENLPDCASIEKDPKTQLIKLWALAEETLAADRAEKEAKHRQEGQLLWRTLDGMWSPKPHLLSLYPFQAFGYLSEQKAWNNFSPTAMQGVIQKINALGIKADLGVNNPNTGSEVISWQTQDDYWILCIDCLGSTKSNIESQYDASIREILSTAKPDSIRCEFDQGGRVGDAGFMQYVMWWD